jgi:beta-galactosidase/beta-glucuronidase
LLSWSDTALENFSGDAAYETDFTLPAGYLKHHVLLDCGEVGVAAEVWVNGQRAGVRVWKPFTFDITHLLRPGQNRLRIVVTNSEGNKIAVGPWRANLPRIRINGLLGPVCIVPYLDELLVCKKQ